MTQIMKNIGGLVGINASSLITSESLYYLKSYLVVLVIGIIGSSPIPKKIATKYNKFANIIEPIFLLTILIISTSFIINSTYNPFLYFRF